MYDDDVNGLRFKINEQLAKKTWLTKEEHDLRNAVASETDKDVLTCISDELSEREKPVQVQVVPKVKLAQKATNVKSNRNIKVVSTELPTVADTPEFIQGQKKSTQGTSRYASVQDEKKTPLQIQEPVQNIEKDELDPKSKPEIVIEDLDEKNSIKYPSRPLVVPRQMPDPRSKKGGQPTRQLRNYEGLYTKSLPMLTHFFVSSKGKNMADILDRET
jgi:TusA-related sulfurtransferase